MIEELLTQVGAAVQTDLPLAALCALGWGLVSVLFSPCHLAAIPVMAAHAAGYMHAPPLTEGASRPQENPQAISPVKVPVRMDTSLGFAAGYFLAIAGLGALCALLGRVVEWEWEHFWMFPAGLILMWFALSLWREHDCSGAGRVLEKLRRGLRLEPWAGSVVMGTGYGMLSGGCTLAFLAPVLLVSLPQGAGVAVLMTVSFALGHCLPMSLVGFVGLAGGATPLFLCLARICHLRAADQARQPPQGEHEQHHEEPHGHTHHMLERVFRKLASLAIGMGGLALLLHGFWE